MVTGQLWTKICQQQWFVAGQPRLSLLDCTALVGMCGRDDGKSKESMIKAYSPETKLQKQKEVSKVMDVGVLLKGMRDSVSSRHL